MGLQDTVLALYESRDHASAAEIRAHGTAAEASTVTARKALSTAYLEATLSLLLEAQVGDRVQTDPHTVLTVASKDLSSQGVVLTTDGKRIASPLNFHQSTWEADEVLTDGTAVYYERWNSSGMRSHGYVHPTSRQLVQSG